MAIKDFPNSDEKIQKMVDKFGNLDIFCKAVGYNDVEIDNKESLGYFMADVIRNATKSDLAFQNPGGVRLNKLSEGTITAKDIYTMDPFDNIILKYKVSGQEIIDMLDFAYNKTEDFPLLCSGCSCIIHRNDSEEIEHIEIVLDNGKPLNPNAQYNLSINSYMASVYGFEQRHKGKIFPTSNEIIFNYLKKHQHINYAGVSRIK